MCFCFQPLLLKCPSNLLWEVHVEKIQPCDKFHPDRTCAAAAGTLEPLQEIFPPLRCHVQQLTRWKLFLWNFLDRNIASRFEPFQCCICLALAEMPDMPKICDD